MKNKFRKMAILLFIAPSLAFAQEGNQGSGSHGGGGEAEFQQIAKKVHAWLVRSYYREHNINQKLELSSNGIKDEEVFITSVTSTISNRFSSTPVTVTFTDKPLTATENGGSRICINQPLERKIICNHSLWNSASETLKYTIVLHEHLGINNFEKTTGDVSSFRISGHVSSYFEEIKNGEELCKLKASDAATSPNQFLFEYETRTDSARPLGVMMHTAFQSLHEDNNHCSKGTDGYLCKGDLHPIISVENVTIMANARFPNDSLNFAVYAKCSNRNRYLMYQGSANRKSNKGGMGIFEKLNIEELFKAY